MKNRILKSVDSYYTFETEAQENENVSNLYDIATGIERNRRVIEWLQNALTKKVKKGLFPEVEYLTQCSTLKQLTTQCYKELGTYATANEKKDFMRLIALDILRNVAYNLD